MHSNKEFIWAFNPIINVSLMKLTFMMISNWFYWYQKFSNCFKVQGSMFAMAETSWNSIWNFGLKHLLKYDKYPHSWYINPDRLSIL